MEPNYEAAAKAAGARLKELRQALHLSQREMARQLGVSSGYISYVEKGVYKINVPILIGIAERYPSADLYWILTGKSRGREDGFLSGYSSNVLDLDAVCFAQENFSLELEKADENRGRLHKLLAAEHLHFEFCYRVYLARVLELTATGVSEGEARSRAARECEAVKYPAFSRNRQRKERT